MLNVLLFKYLTRVEALKLFMWGLFQVIINCALSLLISYLKQLNNAYYKNEIRLKSSRVIAIIICMYRKCTERLPTKS